MLREADIAHLLGVQGEPLLCLAKAAGRGALAAKNEERVVVDVLGQAHLPGLSVADVTRFAWEPGRAAAVPGQGSRARGSGGIE